MALGSCGEIRISSDRMEIRSHGTRLFPAAAYLDDLSAFSVSPHWHDEMEVFSVSSGCAVIHVGAESFLLSEGEGAFINSGSLHGAFRQGKGACLHSIVFHPRLISGGSGTIFSQKYIEPLLSDASIGFVRLSADETRLLEEAWSLMEAEDEGYEIRVRNALSSLIASLVPKCPERREEKESRAVQRMKMMLGFISGNLSSPITVSDIARSAYISESECERCFRKIVGTSPIQYVKELRISQAAELLLKTERPVSEIALSVGFQDMSYFSASFRRSKGMAPSAFRRRQAR